MECYRGEVWFADLGSREGSEQAGKRPVVIIQNDTGNHFSPTIIVVSVSSSDRRKNNMPTHTRLSIKDSGLKFDSICLCEQIRTIDKSKLVKRIKKLPSKLMQDIDEKLKISLQLEDS